MVRLLNDVKTTAAGRSLWQGIAAQLRLLWRLASICVGWRPASGTYSPLFLVTRHLA